MKKHGLLATYPARKESLLEMLPTIAPQLDRMYIYCNQYSVESLIDLSRQVAELNKGSGCTIRFVDPSFAEGDIRDMGKFWIVHALRGFIFLIDDDLLYPKNYCQQHINLIEQEQCISAVHVRWIKRLPMSRYYSDTQSLHFRRKLEPGKIPTAHIAGTGTVAFHTDHFRIGNCGRHLLQDYSGMADIFFAMKANEKNVQIKAIPRTEFWLQDTKASHKTTSLYVQTRNDSGKVCNAINKTDWNLKPQDHE